MDRFPSLVRCLSALALTSLAVACGGEPSSPTPSDSSALVGRWAGVTEVDDFSFAEGRAVTLDEIFELRADGSMRGDFAGWDETSGCVIWYSLVGSFSVDEGALDVAWSSIRSRFAGCTDESEDQPASEVDADEHAIWDGELDGVWSVGGDSLTLSGPAGTVSYRRVHDPLVARWHGTTEVSDFEFAPGRAVTLEEDFWINVDGTIAGFFRGVEPASGCAIDYRLRGGWSASADTVNVEWTEISAEIYGCAGPGDSPREEISADEYEIWNDEFDGVWTATDTTLTIDDGASTIEYSRGL